MWRGAIPAVAVGAIVVAGCYHAGADGCQTDQCRADVAAIRGREAIENSRRKAAAERFEACRRAEADPKAPPAYVHDCRAERWRLSGIYCTDNRLNDRLVQVTCELPAWSGTPDFGTGLEKSLQSAAFAALSAGRTYLILAGEDPLEGHFQNSTTPVQCEQKDRGRYAAAQFFSAMAASGPDATTTCRQQFGGATTCDTKVRQQPPMPQPQFECYGGDQISNLTSTTARQRFELLTDEEAAGRMDPNLPLDRRPWSARWVAQTFSDMR